MVSRTGCEDLRGKEAARTEGEVIGVETWGEDGAFHSGGPESGESQESRGAFAGRAEESLSRFCLTFFGLSSSWSS